MTLIIDPMFLNPRNSSEDVISRIPKCNILKSGAVVDRKFDFECPVFSDEKMDTFVSIDIETTGLSVRDDRIVELGAIKFVNGIAVECFHSFINPERSIPIEGSEINHVSNSMVANAPKLFEVLPSFERFIDGMAIVGHNLEFDLKFLHCSGCKILSQTHIYLDTYSLSKMNEELINHKFSTLCKYYGVKQVKAHFALYDSYFVGKVFLEMIK